MENQQETSSPRRKKGFPLITVVVTGFALCAVMKTLVCGKIGEFCLCQEQSK